MSHWEDLEKLVTTLYLKEIDQEENVWRSLPFFSATLALEVLVLNQALPAAAATHGMLWWILVGAGATLSVTILSVLIFLYRSIRRRSFSYVASGRDLVGYVRQLEAAEQLAETGLPGTEADPQPSIREQLRETLIGQLAAAADANRFINQSRAAERTRAGILLLASIVTTIAFVGVTIGHEVSLKLHRDMGHEARGHEAINQQGGRPAAPVGRHPGTTDESSSPQRCEWSARVGHSARAYGPRSRWRS